MQSNSIVGQGKKQHQDAEERTLGVAGQLLEEKKNPLLCAWPPGGMALSSLLGFLQKCVCLFLCKQQP